MRTIDKSKLCHICKTRPNWLKRAYCDSCGQLMCIGHATRVPNPLGFLASLYCPTCAKALNVWRPEND